MENPPYVPYQAYKSKRHSRVQSNPQATPVTAAPPVQTRPVPAVANGLMQSDPSLIRSTDGAIDAEKRPIVILNGRNSLQRPVSMIGTLTHVRQVSSPSPEPAIEKVIVEKPIEKPLPSPLVMEVPSPTPPTLASQVEPAPPPLMVPNVTSTPTPAIASLPVPPVSRESPPKTNGKATAQSSPVAGPSTLAPTSSDKLLASPRKSSTFRHVPLRPPATRQTLPSSPLRPASMHMQSLSARPTSPTPAERHMTEPRSAASSSVSTPTMLAQDRALPPIPVFDLQTRQSPSLFPVHAPNPTHMALMPAATVPQLQTSSRMASPMQDTTSPAVSSSPSPALTASTSASSAVPSSSRTSARSPAPYRPGFQPRGMYRQRTDEFLEARNQSRDAGRIERTRLERRLEKLISLHFSPPGQKKVEVMEPQTMQQNRRASSFWDLDLSDLKNKSAGDLWREVVSSQASQGGKNDVRAAEQRITPWEEDASVSQCPLCSASFHPLTNRKHHCRLCGRIICSLPVKYPQRPETCSLLFVVDPGTGRIEEVGEGVDYGVRRRTASQGKPQKRGEVLNEDEKFLKGVRICRECRPVLLRQQYRHEMGTVPLFTRLYDAFVSLEKEIEDELPAFHELVVNLSKHERPTPEATAARKRLLEAFAQYDALSKRIRKLPCPQGGSQDRIQGAIIIRANLFLQKNMFPLQTLPKPKTAEASSPQISTPQEDQIIDPDSEVARVLQPLLEQEALLETFVEEAKAHRKFEDMKTLKSNLREIRLEIEHILANAEDHASSHAYARTPAA